MLPIEDQKYNKIVYKVEKNEEGMTLKSLLKKQWEVSSRLMSRLKKDKRVTINSKWAPYHQILQKNDLLVLNMEEESCDFTPINIPLNIIYEDFDVLVINKPPGMLTHPTAATREGTLANAVMNYMNNRGECYKIRFVNRLDMDTSGAMILAKNSFAHQQLAAQLQSKMVKKYLAFVLGRVDKSYQKVEAPIYRPETIPENEPPRRVVDSRGKMAVSHLEKVEVYSKASLIRIKIDTGRTHQIRVHAHHIGHPIIGDEFYEPDQPNRIKRQALHAERIIFDHPRTKEEIECNAELPDDLIELKRLLEKEI
ncbi:RluA family pseudouridine synthase [Tindallia californiensis]|uniref:Pseudouridine synthase n=1 Tax=Tindallia californiensis TaxID=159292 RepID=A0A1H3IE78_9FIRM|nr:RluA family pseudouridine synthase [Tindallia californiensis]SDY26153.1 23S rRNA pseudouridine1911/1915/1917 synthase [Tindallia californiensis]